MTRRPSTEDVELNVTAMLDMAFQLLAFFVLTFKPPPGELQIYLKLPPVKPIEHLQGTQEAGADDTKDPKDVKPTKSLLVTIVDSNDAHGTISSVTVGIPGVGEPVSVPLNDLDKELRTWFTQRNFEQAVINASPTLRWDEVLKVMDMFTKFTTSKGEIPAVSVSSAGVDPDPPGG